MMHEQVEAPPKPPIWFGEVGVAEWRRAIGMRAPMWSRDKLPLLEAHCRAVESWRSVSAALGGIDDLAVARRRRRVRETSMLIGVPAPWSDGDV